MSTTSLPSTMRAVLHDLSTKKISIADSPLPQPKPTEYLIAPSAAAFTLGELDWPRPPEFTISTPGVEYTGRVVAVPSASGESSKFKVGDVVYARVMYPQPGGAREYTVAAEDELALAPRNVSDEEAATVPVNALTAWQWLFEEAGLTPPGENGAPRLGKEFRILVTGAAGSVGQWAVQLGRLLGVTVIAVASGKNLDFVRELGADEVVDYTTTDLKAWAEEDPSRKADLVLENVGGPMVVPAWFATKEGGRLYSIVAPEDMQWKFDLTPPEGVKGVQGKFFIMHPSGEQLASISRLIEQGKLKTVVDSVFEFDEVDKAVERLNSRKTRGKVVLRVGSKS